MLAKLTFKNQITIPKVVINAFPRVEYFDVEQRQSEIVLRPVTISSESSEVEKIRDHMEALGLTEKDVEAAVRWARRHRS